GQAVRQHHPGLDQLGGSAAPDAAPGSLHGHPVRRHPAVRKPRRPGRPADRGRDRRDREREPGAEDQPGRRVAVHAAAAVRGLTALGGWGPGEGRARPGAPSTGACDGTSDEEGSSVTVIEDLAPPPKVAVERRAASRREAWLRRLPLLPALIYTIVVTQIP